jgi:hypothetical protein
VSLIARRTPNGRQTPQTGLVRGARRWHRPSSGR